MHYSQLTTHYCNHDHGDDDTRCTSIRQVFALEYDVVLFADLDFSFPRGLPGPWPAWILSILKGAALTDPTVGTGSAKPRWLQGRLQSALHFIGRPDSSSPINTGASHHTPAYSPSSYVFSSRVIGIHSRDRAWVLLQVYLSRCHLQSFTRRGWPCCGIAPSRYTRAGWAPDGPPPSACSLATCMASRAMSCGSISDGRWRIQRIVGTSSAASMTRGSFGASECNAR